MRGATRRNLRMRLKTDRAYFFPFEPDEFWVRISDVAEFPAWWPWLRTFDGARLKTGEVWRCTVKPPVPYAVRFTVTIDEVAARRLVVGTIAGDIVGTARLQVEPVAAGTALRLIADLSPRKQSLSILSVAARPIVRYGHNWVLDTGARQFLDRSSPGQR